MSFPEEVRPLLAARASTDPDAARLLEMFTRAYETLNTLENRPEARLLSVTKEGPSMTLLK
jgi:hypothetical protein